MWSIGNEMTEGTGGISNFNQVQQNLIDWVKAVDTTRPVTTGDNQYKNNGSTTLNPQASRTPRASSASTTPTATCMTRLIASIAIGS